MTQTLSIVIPGPPQGKGRPRIGKVGAHARMFTPAKTAAYEGLVSLAAQQVMQAAGVAILNCPVSCHITAVMPIPVSWSQAKRRRAICGQEEPTTKPDGDNIVKAIFDGFNGVLWRDDVLCTSHGLQKVYGEQPGVYVTVRWRA